MSHLLHEALADPSPPRAVSYHPLGRQVQRRSGRGRRLARLAPAGGGALLDGGGAAMFGAGAVGATGPAGRGALAAL